MASFFNFFRGSRSGPSAEPPDVLPESIASQSAVKAPRMSKPTQPPLELRLQIPDNEWTSKWQRKRDAPSIAHNGAVSTKRRKAHHTSTRSKETRSKKRERVSAGNTPVTLLPEKAPAPTNSSSHIDDSRRIGQYNGTALALSTPAPVNIKKEDDEEEENADLDSIVVTGTEASVDDNDDDGGEGDDEGHKVDAGKTEDEEDDLRGDESSVDLPELSGQSMPFSNGSIDEGIPTGRSDLSRAYEYLEYSSGLDDEDSDDGVDENWEWLFEEESLPATSDAPDPWEYWPIDEEELRAYQHGVASVEGYNEWTADEQRLHRLLALRGFHPLLPASWAPDFLGVPMYPALFAPLEEDAARLSSASASSAPLVITNYGSQFRATKALRALFELQSRVSGLRHTGYNTARIGAIIERELRRYIAWAATDAGLDRCGPLAAMPNIAAKQFVVGSGRKTKRHSLVREIQDYFGDWVTRYRAYYANLPEYEVEGGRMMKMSPPRQGLRKSRGQKPQTHCRLHPPRLLYGFVIVQHLVMLMVVDAAANRSSRHPRPRCLADFNLSLGDRWLDASLNVAIPVHVARAAQLRCREGMILPGTRVDNVDEDL